MQVSASMGRAMGILSHQSEACEWYGRALHLATVIASEDTSLQLYSLLHRFVIFEWNSAYLYRMKPYLYTNIDNGTFVLCIL